MKITSLLASIAASTVVVLGQNPDIFAIIQASDLPMIAVPAFHGAGAAQGVMGVFNDVLWRELAGSGALRMAPQGLYPLTVPQQPQDFKPQRAPWLTDWSGPPVSANYLAIGYTAEQGGQLVLRGWLFNVRQPDVASAQVFGKLYFGQINAEGAKKVAREFAADILQQLGAKSLLGTKIYFSSDRTGSKEIWSMDYDGSNQQQLTHLKNDSSQPAVSPDGKMYAFVTYAKRPGEAFERPQFLVYSTDTGRRLAFESPNASLNSTPEFTPDSRHILFSSSLGSAESIYSSDLRGGNLQKISNGSATEVSPKVNPKTGTDVLFISDASGAQQLWRMNISGADREMLTPGTGEAANPSWNPNGRLIAFAWTRGYEIGGFNIFVMDIGKRVPIQITSNSGVNENPSWAPDEAHLVYSSRRGDRTQIYTMLADGSGVQQLTTEGDNIQPVWVGGP